MATVLALPLLHAAPGAHRPLRCPKCGAAFELASHGPVEIDRCTGCGGIFLDAGELDAITWAERNRLLGQVLGRRRST